MKPKFLIFRFQFKEKLDKYLGFNKTRNVVLQYGMTRLKMIETRPSNLVQTIAKVNKKGGGQRQVLIRSILATNTEFYILGFEPKGKGE